MQGRDGAEGGRGRGHSSNGRGRGNPLNGRAGRSAPFQNGQGRHTQFQNGMAFSQPESCKQIQIIRSSCGAWRDAKMAEGSVAIHC